MKYLTKEDGKISFTNILNIVAFATGVFELAKPFIPAEYIPYVILGFSVVNLYLRTFQTDGSPIQK